MFDVTGSLRFLGRVAKRGDVIYLGNTGTGFEIETDARKVTAIITTKANVCEDDLKAAYLGVYLNGSEEPVKTVKLDNPEKEYILYEGDGSTVKIRLFKLTEASQAFVGIKGVYADGDVTPTSPKDKRIEFIGDSITCGYGNMSEGPQIPFRTSEENGHAAYASLLARMLDADQSIVASSGIGVYSSWTGKDEINDGLLISHLYPYENKYIDDRLKRAPEEWDFSSFLPQLVVVYVGTNDSTYIRYAPEERLPLFRESYASFIRCVREKNPEAHILCVYSALKDGPLDYRIYAVIEDVCRSMNGEGDSRVSPFLLPPVDVENEGFGAQEHPNWLTHRRYAKLLYAHIKENGII